MATENRRVTVTSDNAYLQVVGTWANDSTVPASPDPQRLTLSPGRGTPSRSGRRCPQRGAF
jgi:hypothetical protein